MASHNASKACAIFALFLASFLQGSLGNIECKNLNKDSCAYAVSSSGKRCVLEKHVRRSGEALYTCSASNIQAENLSDYIETDRCVAACGLDRSALGISSDSLLDSRFAQKLCSNECYQSCPNIVDLYFNLAAGEGVYLPKFCSGNGSKSHREMFEIKSSGFANVAFAPQSSTSVTSSKIVNGDAPALAPF